MKNYKSTTSEPKNHAKINRNCKKREQKKETKISIVWIHSNGLKK